MNFLNFSTNQTLSSNEFTLTEEMEEKINYYKNKDPNDLIWLYDIQIRLSNFLLLIENKRLNDSVMEAYFKLISIKYEKIYVFNQFIKDNLINKQFSKIIKIWLRNVNLLSYDLVFLPIFDLDCEHFTLMVF